jgi:ubiquinone/menaquinone biosynthesis C-methylase UbiE
MPEESTPQLDPVVRAFYENEPEESRLSIGVFQIEETRTRELISRHIPKPPARVLDVGGAAGAYAFWLGDQGYQVHLIDASRRLVSIAEERNSKADHRLSSCAVGDARLIQYQDESADVVLMLGPLYHLLDRDDRLRALREAFRVLRPDGVILAAGISRWGSLLDGLSRDLIADPQFATIVERDLLDGHHLNPTGRFDYFTTAYFHRPEELRDEVLEAGFDVEGLYGIEGPGWILPDFEQRWNDQERRETLLRVARRIESDPAMIGSSAHMMVVGRKSL